jgi:hypothetical protein
LLFLHGSLHFGSSCVSQDANGDMSLGDVDGDMAVRVLKKSSLSKNDMFL